jgi:membrane associated rhomboid family serine protease
VTGLLLGFRRTSALLSRLHVRTPATSATRVCRPCLVILGWAFGAIVPPAFNSATQGVDFKDAGVASAMVNTMQQVGGSIGAAMLSAYRRPSH